jgi:hypothetical protein
MKPKTIQLVFDLALFCNHAISELMLQSIGWEELSNSIRRNINDNIYKAMNEQLYKERNLNSQTDRDSLLLPYKVKPGKWAVMSFCDGVFFCFPVSYRWRLSGYNAENLTMDRWRQVYYNRLTVGRDISHVSQLDLPCVYYVKDYFVSFQVRIT